MSSNPAHYLRDELYSLVQTDARIFEFLQSGSLDGLWYWDMERQEKEWLSAKFWEVLGYDPAAQEHKSAEAFAHLLPEDVPALQAELTRHLAEPERPFDTILRFRHASGSTVVVRCRGLVIRDAEGRPVRMLGAHNDLTRERRVERLLNETNRAARIGAWEITLATNEVYWSEVTREIHEVSPDFVPELSTGINFYREGYSRTRIVELVQLATTAGTPWDEELQIVTATGVTKWVRAVGQAEFVGGKPTRVLGSFQDIDAQKRRDIQLAEREQLLSLNFDFAPHGMAILAPDGRLRRVSRSFCTLLGYTREELLGLHLADVTYPEDAVDEAEMLRRFFTSEHEGFRGERRYVTKAGQLIWADVAVGVLRDDDGAPKSFHLQLADVTASKQEEERMRRIAFLVDKAHEMEQFAYIASHDLRQPVLTIKGYVQAFLEDYGERLDEDAGHYLKVVLRAADRMDGMMQGLLDYSRLSQSKQQESVDLDALLREVCSGLAAHIERHGATLHLPSMPRVMGFPIELRQLLQHLLTNAIHYCRPGVPPEVWVTCERISGGHTFAVADNGVGIAAEDQERIFGLFQRVGGPLSTTGTGIGLASCRTIVVRHGGRIWVDSALGAGSTFRFTLLTGESDS